MALVQNISRLNPRELRGDISENSGLSARSRDRAEDKLVCPRPRRVTIMSVSTVESTTKIAWQRRSASSHMLDSEISLEIMDIFCSKDSAAHSSDFDYSNPFFSGSPPCRASNPIVHDAEFRQLRQKPVYLEKLDDKKSPVQDLVSCHRRLVSPASATPQSKQKISSPRYKSSPRVRIEGFDCSGHVFDCAGLDSRRQVPAMA